MGIVALAATALALPVEAPAHGEMPSGMAPTRFQKRGKGQNNRRGKGKRSPPKSRPNMLTISKRVRRKHRRSV
jgi:hypothetical protein